MKNSSVSIDTSIDASWLDKHNGYLRFDENCRCSLVEVVLVLAAVLSGDKIYGRLIKVEVTAASLDILYMFALVMF